MEDLIKKWNTQYPNQHLGPCLQKVDKEIWVSVSKLLSMKKSALNFEEKTSKDVQLLVKEHDQLCTDKKSLTIATDRLKSDLQLLESEMTDLKMKNSETIDRCNQMTFKVEVMKARAVQCREDLRIINEYTERLEKIATERARLTCRHGKKDPRGNDLPKREIKGLCKELMESNEEVNQFTDKRDTQRKTGWTKAECLLLDHTPYKIWHSLVSLTQESTTELNMRLKRFSETTLNDTSTNSKIQSVQRHIQELQLLHLIKSQSLLKLRQTSCDLASRQNTLVQLWKELVIMNYPSMNKESLFRWFELSIELNGLEAALKEVGVACDSMEHFHQERTKMAEVSKKKNTEIRQFREAVEEKQRAIRALVKHNASAKEKLKQQQIQTQMYIDQKLHPLGTTTVLFLNLKDQILREMSLYSTTLQQLDATTTRTTSGVYKCPETAFIQLMDKLRSEKQVNQCCEHGKTHLIQMQSHTVKQQDALAIMSESKSFVERHEGPLRCEADGISTMASKGFSALSETELIMKEWWEQPGQNTISWETVEDMTVEQWLEQWRILATKYTTLR